MNLPEQAAPTPQPYSEPPATATAYPLVRTTAPQSWMARIADAKYHWYDLIAGFPEKTDIHDPIGRYLRRMQFELDAVAERRHLFFAVSRPRVRFDVDGAVQWGFFSLKLTLPLLVGVGQVKESITFELKVPFAATLKKPSVTLTPNFVTFNWGGLIEALSIHDVLQTYAHALKVPSKVLYVGQTLDPEALLAKARLPALQKLHAQHNDEFDTLLLIQQVELQVNSAEGDPAALPQNDHPWITDALQSERMDVLEAALIRYFEGSKSRERRKEESEQRSARLEQVRADNNLVQFTIDLQWPDTGNYNELHSVYAPAAKQHLLSCFIADGQAVVSSMPVPAPAKGGK